jgi:hypothetical protein
MLAPLILQNLAPVAGDSTPDDIAFTAQTDVAVSTIITSNTETISGIDVAVAVSVVGGEYSLNGAAYTSVDGAAFDGDTVTVRGISSVLNSTATTVTLTVGTVSSDFTFTTIAEVTDDLETIPYLIGATETYARAMLDTIFMVVVVEGSGRTVSWQSIEPYTLTARGTTVTITLANATYTPRPSRLGGGGRSRYGSGIQ